MKNIFMLFAIFAMVSCGTTEQECTHGETTTDTVVTETVTEVDTLDVSEFETVGELLDTLETIPVEPVVQ
jgi:hypothetical protein